MYVQPRGTFWLKSNICVWTLACADPDFSGDFLQSSTLPYNLAIRGGLTFSGWGPIIFQA